MEKSFRRKDSGPTQFFFDVLPASFRIPLIHLDLDLWLSPVWGKYFDLLKNRVLERWWGSKGVLGRQSLKAANLKGNLGSCCCWLQQWRTSVRSEEACALFLNPESRGELDLRVESQATIGNSDVTVKFATVHSWVPHLTAEAWNRILFEVRKEEHIGLNFRKCPNGEIWEMANVHNKGSGRSLKFESFKTMLETPLETSWGRRGLSSGKIHEIFSIL